MDWRRACAAVIPCFNEERTIGEVLAGVRRHLETVFVIDDGSTDQTAPAARQAGAEVISQGRNTGKGAALEAGWHCAQQRGFDWALTLDGDGQHSPEDIPRFFECAERTSAALVIGNRMQDAQGMPWVRRWVNRWMSHRLSRAAKLELPDSQCGFRLINLAALGALPVAAAHFEIESEVVLAFARKSHRIEFVPIRALYKGEQSKIHPFRDTLRWFQWWKGVNR